MNTRRPTKPDAEVLSETVRTRLLERASELDAAYRTGGTVAELRAAAVEAGISAPAFETALAELRDAEQSKLEGAGQPRRRSRGWGAIAAVVGLVAVGTLGVSRRTTPADAAAPIIDQRFVLRCVSPETAFELVRPLLQSPMNTIVYSLAAGERVLTISGTREQVEAVRSVLNETENPASPACAR